jgi:hypothetical protein
MSVEMDSFEDIREFVKEEEAFDIEDAFYRYKTYLESPNYQKDRKTRD